MVPRALRFLPVVALAIILAVLLLRSQESATVLQSAESASGTRTQAAPPPPPSPPAVAVVPAGGGVESPSSKPASPTPLTKIEPGTPPKYLKPYLIGYTPAEIYKDGAQIYHDVPFYVRQPYGTMKRQSSMVKIQPTAPAPILEEPEQAEPRKP